MAGAGITGSGPAERELRRLGRRCAGVLRVVVAVCASLLVLLAAPAGTVTLDIGIVLAVTAWGLGYCQLVSQGAGTWLLVADLTAVAAACLTQRWTVSPQALHGGTSWVLGVVSVAVVGWQWHSSTRSGAAVTVVAALAYLAGSAGASAAVAVLVVWFLVEAALSRGLYRLLTIAARATDRVTAEVERARRESALAAARRADEREHLAALHDTAAATLLAIGAGAVNGREPWLARQLADDLATLTGHRATPRGEIDLARLLDDVARQVPVEVDSAADGALNVPAVAAVAICRSVREALVNVARHAGVSAAAVRIESAEGRVVVEVADTGRGFDPARVPAHRRGIELSIVERMARVGGHARVLSVPGGGTRVRLEWPHE